MSWLSKTQDDDALGKSNAFTKLVKFFNQEQKYKHDIDQNINKVHSRSLNKDPMYL